MGCEHDGDDEKADDDKSISRTRSRHGTLPGCELVVLLHISQMSVASQWVDGQEQVPGNSEAGGNHLFIGLDIDEEELRRTERPTARKASGGMSMCGLLLHLFVFRPVLMLSATPRAPKRNHAA